MNQSVHQSLLLLYFPCVLLPVLPLPVTGSTSTWRMRMRTSRLLWPSWVARSLSRPSAQSVSRQRTFGDYLFHQYFSLFSTSCFVNTINTKYQVFSPKFQSNWFFLEEKCPVKVLQFTFKWWSWDIYHNKIKSRVKCMSNIVLIEWKFQPHYL